jgi:carboxypeptidase C (cathepsin A)
LDVADIVYIDPVNTGYSRIVDKETPRSTFFGINSDIKYLADWVKTFVTRQNRWPSPKYLIGESYGTTRVAGLVHELQNSHWMYFNGVVLVSPTGLGLDRSGPVAKANYLPYYAATAWYHKVLPPDLYSQRILMRFFLKLKNILWMLLFLPLPREVPFDPTERKAIAKKMAFYSGISEEVFVQFALAVPTSYYWKELMRDKGLTVGRLDSRYRGIDQTDAGERYDYDPALTAMEPCFFSCHELLCQKRTQI